MLAAYYGHADLVKLLIQHGADPNRLNDKSQSPLAGAVFKKEDDVIEVSGYGVASIMAAANYFKGAIRGWCRSRIWESKCLAMCEYV